MLAGQRRSAPGAAVLGVTLLFCCVRLTSSAATLNTADKLAFQQFLIEWPVFQNATNPDIDGACGWKGVGCDEEGYISYIDTVGRPMHAPLPRALGNFTRLKRISSSKCYVTGTIPPEIFTPSLEHLGMANNLMNGTVPPDIGKSKNLTAIYMNGNQLSGVFPDIPDKLPLLKVLNIDHNKFVCPFPVGLYRLVNPIGNGCYLGANFWDSQGDGTICGEDLPDKGNGNCDVSTYYTPDETTRDPDFAFSSPTIHVEFRDKAFSIFSKLPSGTVNRMEYFVTRVLSANIYDDPVKDPILVEVVPIPKFTTVTKISDALYEVSTELTGVNISRVAVNFDFSEPHYIHYSVNVTGLKPRLDLAKAKYSMHIQHEMRVAILPDNGFLNCSTLSKLAFNCTVPHLYAGGGTSVPVNPFMFSQSANLSMELAVELDIQAPGASSGAIFTANSFFVSGSGEFDSLGSLPLSVPKGRQGFGADLGAALEVSGKPSYLSWKGMKFRLENLVQTPAAVVTPRNTDPLVALMLIPMVIIGVAAGIFVWRRKRKDALANKHLSLLASVSAEMADFSKQPRLGLRQIDSSELVTMQTLGTGSFGSVQLATYKGEFVAVKKLNASGSQEHLDSLMQEAEVMASLAQCKNIVKILGVCNDNSGSAIVMEFCPCGSLNNYLKRRLALSEYEMFKLAFSIMSGMVTLETAKVVHRDLAARNVLLDEHLFAKVSDFGYSHKSSQQRSNAAGDSKDSVGPVKWQAPEALRPLATGSLSAAVTLTTASDVWSFGCTLVEIVTGKEPYHGYKSSIIQLATDVSNGALNPLSHLQEHAANTPIPAWLLPTIRSCFVFKPEDRATFRELRYQMVKAARDLHNQYENEVDQVDSLLNSNWYNASVGGSPTLIPATTVTASSSSRTSAGGTQVFTPESTLASSKVDLSHVDRLNKLGEGSFGAVYLGISQGTYVALKVLSVTASPDDVRREAAVMTAIKQHRNIVQLYGLVSTNDQLEIVMEFAPKGSLEGFLKAAQAGTARVTEALQFKWAVGIARGMQALAASNVIHRDLASRNILLDSTLEPKVSDFGMSRTVLDPNKESSTKTEIGPIRWFAPECFELKYSEKSDVWAYGCTLIELITGEVPLFHLRLLEVAAAVRSGVTPLQGLQGIIHSVPEWLIKTLKMCFKYDAKERASFTDLVVFLESQGSSIQEVREAEEEIQKRRQRRTINLRDQTVHKTAAENK